MSSRRSFFAQLAGAVSLLATGKTLASVPTRHRFGPYSYTIRSAWIPRHNVGIIPVMYKRCAPRFIESIRAQLKPAQTVQGELKWYRNDGTPLS